MQKHWEDEASFSDFIISHLLSCRSRKIQKKILFKLVQKKRMLNQQVFNNNLYRLKKKGILSFDSEQNIFINKNNLNEHILFTKIKEKPAGDTKVMVLFDIPEKKRKTRNWLRLQLKLWNFEMLQQSVWLGKGPTPKEFTDRLKLLNISECVKIFKIQNINKQK
jgi:DNA-binding transcriptional regulator PaaX